MPREFPLAELRDQVRGFARERDWEQFHTPKNLAMGLAVEAAELLEIFLWTTGEPDLRLNKEKFKQLQNEIGDVLIYLVNLADKFDLDPLACAYQKLEVNRALSILPK